MLWNVINIYKGMLAHLYYKDNTFSFKLIFKCKRSWTSLIFFLQYFKKDQIHYRLSLNYKQLVCTKHYFALRYTERKSSGMLKIVPLSFITLLNSSYLDLLLP